MKQTSYAEWKAQQLNALFEKHGKCGRARITAATVRHGIGKEATRIREKSC